VFANSGYFATVYPMDTKSKAGDALRTFFQEFGVPDRWTCDGSKEQTGKKTEFMQQVRKNDIDLHVIEPERLDEYSVKKNPNKILETYRAQKTGQNLWSSTKTFRKSSAILSAMMISRKLTRTLLRKFSMTRTSTWS